MEPFFDCGLFELIFAAIALMACLNFVYRRMVMLIFFTLLSIGCSIYAVIAANGNLKTAIAILGFTALLALIILTHRTVFLLRMEQRPIPQDIIY